MAKLPKANERDRAEKRFAQWREDPDLRDRLARQDERNAPGFVRDAEGRRVSAEVAKLMGIGPAGRPPREQDRER